MVAQFFFFAVLMTSCNKQIKPKDEQKNTTVAEPKEKKTVETKIDLKNFKNNTATDIGNEVLSILQDRNNNYWFGTNQGVYCFDGKSLVLFTTDNGLYQNQVQKIQEDESGTIWFTTGGYGVNRFDGKKITTQTYNNNDQLQNNWKIEPGDLWFYAGGGTFRYHNNSFTYLPFPNSKTDLRSTTKPPYQASAYGVYKTLKDRGGNLWFGTQAMGVCRYDGKSFTWLTEKGLQGPAVLALFEDRNGILWFGNNGKGLFRYDGKTLTNFTDEKGLSNPEFIKSGKEITRTLARVWSLNEDNAGNLWIGTGDSGIWRYDGTNLINYTAKDGLPNKGIETIYKDKKGELWFGTDGDGVYKFNGIRFTRFTIQ